MGNEESFIETPLSNVKFVGSNNCDELMEELFFLITYACFNPLKSHTTAFTHRCTKDGEMVKKK